MSLEHDYIHADSPKSLPPIPVRVSRRSQLTAALRQYTRPIVHRGPRASRSVRPSVTCAGVTTVGAWRGHGNYDVVRDRSVVRSQGRAALVRRSLCFAGERTEGDPKTKTHRS